MASRVSREEYEQLCRTIQRWNINRVEIFEITMPNENLEFEGIMRFYFQNPGADSNKIATKCIRVSSSASTEEVVDELTQKFCPDSWMLPNQPSFALYEVHSHTERKLERDNCPLMVQLSWVKGEREGRFLLRQEASSSKAKKALKELAKKEKKISKKKKSKKGISGGSTGGTSEGVKEEGESGTIARSLYTVMPESRFTRSISIKSNRNQIIKGDKRRLSLPGDETDNDGTVDIYAYNVLPDVPCRSLLISSRDTAAQVVRSALDKYGLREDSQHFCLVQVIVPSSSFVGSDPQLNVNFSERILGDSEYPLLVHNDNVQFHLCRRSSFAQRSRSHSPTDDLILPALVEIFQGAQSPPQTPRRFPLSLESTEIGSNVALLDSKSYICLTSPGIKPRHCVISSIQDLFTISPLSKQAVIYVNNKFIKEPQFLPHNAVVRLGDREIFRFFAPTEVKQPSSSVRTLPTNFGRSGSSSGGRDLPAKHDFATPLRGENISKAFSVEDILNPPTHRDVVGRKLKGRAVSEYNLKAEDDFDGDAFKSPDVPGKLGSKHADPSSISPVKRRLYSLPQVGEPELKAQEWVLPAALSFYQTKEMLLLQSMISEVNGYLLQFKLAPAYGLYMVVKHHLALEFQSSMSSSERQKCLLLTIKSIVSQIKRAVKESRNIAGALVFWLANTSEFLNFLRRDYQLVHVSADYESPLTHIIHSSYKQFTQCMLKELSIFLPAFYDESSEADSEEGYISGGEANGIGKEPDVVPVVCTPGLSRQSSITGVYWSVAGSKIRRRGRPTIGDVLMTLGSTVSLLKRCRVNATLSVMTFAILFRYISTKLFNKLVTEGKYCSRSVGQKLRRRLERVKAWAEKEGMELPAETHLSMVVQAANLLQAVKKLPEDAQTVFATCPKLNSRQVTAFLHHCSLTDGEMTVNQGFVEAMIVLAEGHMDQLLQNDGMEVNLEEDPNLELPYVVPHMGYSCDSIQGLPIGLQDFLEPMISAGLCKLAVNKDSSGFWSPPAQVTASTQSLDRSSPPTCTYGGSNTLPRTIGHSQHRRPSDVELRGSSTLPRHSEELPDLKVLRITLTKEQNSLGISIVGGKYSVTQGDVGIFVRSMVEGGAAYQDGRLQPGDQILNVDNYSLDGCTQEQAAYILRGTGKTVTLTVAKQAAMFYGLTNLLHQSSPRYTRKHDPATVPPEGSSHARKAHRRQKRERERERERQRLQQLEFKLERRKPLELQQQPQVESNHLPPAPPSFISSSAATTTTSNLPKARFSPNTNPQFTKWIMEQNFHCNPEKESKLDMQGSMSSLTNIPERDRGGSPVPSYTTTSTRPTTNSSDRGGYYRPPSPPIRDSGPSRPSDYNSSYSNFDGLEHVETRTNSDAPSKFSEYTASEPDHQFVPIPNVGPVVPPHLGPTSSSASVAPYTDNFTSLSSQPTLSSQQMLTPYSQQHPPIPGNSQLFDRLSMDVMQHTQHSGTLVGGITSMVPKLNTTKLANSPHPLERSDLKGLEMDEIDLIKQRLQLMYYSQQKQERDRGNSEQDDKPQLSRGARGPKPIPPQLEGQAGVQNHTIPTPDYLGRQEDFGKPPGLDEDDDVFPEHGERSLSTYQLRKELESLEQMVCDQKKRCKEIKMAKEREELTLRQREQELMNSSGMLGINPRDQHRWQREQKRRLRELEKVRSEQSERLRQFEYEEHRARSKLKAFEAQANELKQQIEVAEANSNAGVLRPPPTGGYSTMEPQGEIPEFHHASSHQPDMVPSKLPSSSDHRGMRAAVREGRARVTSHPFSSNHVTAPTEHDWADSTSKSVSSRVMSVESMATSTWIANEQPDIAREVATTMSVSTEPTQDEPLLPPPSKWAVHGSTNGAVTISDLQPSSLVQNTDFSAQLHSKPGLTEEQLSQEERLKELREEHLLAAASKDPRGPTSGQMESAEVRESHVAQLQREKHQYNELQSRKPSGTQSHEVRTTATELPAMANLHSEQRVHVPDSRSPDSARHQATAHRVHPQQMPHQHTWVDSHGMQPYVRYQGPQQGIQRTRVDHHHPPRSTQHPRGYPVRNGIHTETYPGSVVPQPGTDRPIQGSPVVQTPPDVVPTALGALPPYGAGSHRKAPPTDRSPSTSTATKYSDVSSTPNTAVRPFSPHQRGTSPQGSRPYPHPTHPPQPLPKQELSLGRVSTKSPTDRPMVASAFTSPRYLPSSARSPLSPSRPTQDPASTGKPPHSKTLDLRSMATSYENVKPQNTPQREPPVHHPPSTPSSSSSSSSTPKSSHRYGVSRPENKGLGRSYSRGRPDALIQQMNYDGRPKGHLEKPYRATPQQHFQGPARHPDRIKRQQTEL